uniref:Uncharacterized protein n=1 Tax=Anopheles farauti TaxID=69004 RepID=A0A182QK33_9DIPT
MLCAINIICLLHLVHSRLDTCPAAPVFPSLPGDRSTIRLPIAGSSAPTTPTAAAGPVALRRTSLGSSHNLSSFGMSVNSSNKPVRTTHIGTLAATGRQHTTGERIPVATNGTTGSSRQSKTIPNRTGSTAAPTNGTGLSPSKLNGLNGTTKRTANGGSVIRPPSSFGSSNNLVSVETLKSKSAPATPLSSNGGNHLVAAAGGSESQTTNGEVSTSSSSESDSDKDTVVNGATILGSLKLIPTNGVPNGGQAVGCSELASTATNNSNNNAVNGIVGH